MVARSPPRAGAPHAISDRVGTPAPSRGDPNWRIEMAVLSEDGRLAGEAGQMALLTESAAGIAVIVLAIIGLAESASAVLAAVATIVIGGGLMVAALNATMEEFQALSMVSRPTAGEQMVEIGGRAVVALMAGVSGV